MIIKKLKGFTLIEIIVAISISSVIISSLFFLLSNINILTSFTKDKSNENIEFVYFYHLIKNDLSNSLPGMINDQQSIYLENQNELIINSMALNIETPHLVKIKWQIEDKKIFRTLLNFGENVIGKRKLIIELDRETNFKVEKINELSFFSNTRLSPSLLSVIIGSKKPKIMTFQIGNNL